MHCYLYNKKSKIQDKYKHLVNASLMTHYNKLIQTARLSSHLLMRSGRVFPESFFFPLFLPSVTLLVLYTGKKRCDEKDRLIISTWFFGMIHVKNIPSDKKLTENKLEV